MWAAACLRPTRLALYAAATVTELQDWGFIGEVEVVDPTWIDVAYTWSRPGSLWKAQAVQQLEEQGIYQVGRYARWNFQGIADSIKDGFYAGAALREMEPVPMVTAAGQVTRSNGQEVVQPMLVE